MTANGLVAPIVVLSATVFALILLGKRRRKVLLLILASVLPSCVFLIVTIRAARDYNSVWGEILFVYALFLSVVVNLLILAVVWIARRLRS